MKKNEIYTLSCTDISNQGYGICRQDSMVVFVFDLLPQEQAQVRIIKVLKHYAFGKVIVRYTTSSDRIAPRCPLFGKCGGCAFQHLDYQKSLEVKQNYVRSLCLRSGLDVQVQRPLGQQDLYFYRNKAQFPVDIKQGHVQLGFYRPHSHSIVDCPQCMIQDNVINDLYMYIRKTLSLQDAQELRHILIRSNTKGQLQLVFIGARAPGSSYIKKIVQDQKAIVSIVFNQNTRNDNVILGDAYQILYGTDHLIQLNKGQQMKVHFKSFYQVNPIMMEVLYDHAIKLAHLEPHMRVIDLYSGTGTIACTIAPYVKEVIGVEIVKEAVENAQENARLNHLDNVSFYCGDAGEFIEEYDQEIDVLFVDPPRKGLSLQGIEHISSLDPKKVIYISCNPNTLVRDAKLLEKEGYFCQEIQPVDMFSQTAGLECVSLFVKR